MISKNNGLLIYIVKFLEITKVISSEIYLGKVATALVWPTQPRLVAFKGRTVRIRLVCLGSDNLLDSSSAGSSG